MPYLKLDGSAALLSGPSIDNLYSTAGVDTITGTAGNDTAAVV